MSINVNMSLTMNLHEGTSASIAISVYLSMSMSMYYVRFLKIDKFRKPAFLADLCCARIKHFF